MVDWSPKDFRVIVEFKTDFCDLFRSRLMISNKKFFGGHFYSKNQLKISRNEQDIKKLKIKKLKKEKLIYNCI